MTRRLTTTPDPLTEKVLQRIMAQNKCSRSQAGQLLLKYGTKGVLDRLQAKNPNLALDKLLTELIGGEQ